MTSSLDSSSLYTSTAQFFPSGPSLLMQHSRPTLAFKPLILFLPTSYLLLCTFTTTSCSWPFLFTSSFLFSSLTLSRLFNGMLEVSKPGALNNYTLFRLIPLTLFVSRNLILIHVSLFGSLDSLFYDQIAPTPGLAFFLLLSHTLAAASSFFVRQGFSFSELSTSYLSSLDLYSDYVGVNISLNNSPSLSFLNVYAPPIRFFRRIAEPISFLLPFFPPPKISSFWGTSISTTPSLTQKVLPTPWERSIRLGHLLWPPPPQ